MTGTLTTLTVALDGRQETPPHATAAQGAGTIVFDSSANTVSIDVFMTGIKLADVNGIHLHRAPATVNGPVIVSLLGLGSLSANGTGIEFAASNVPLPSQEAANLLHQGIYMNVHTISFPGGEIRGQVLPQRVFAVGADAGMVSAVKVYNGNGALKTAFVSFAGFKGGVRVATGDVNGDGVLDTVVGAGPGAPGGHVKVFSGRDKSLIWNFLAYPGFNGGVSVAAGDVNGDGFADIIVAAGPRAPGGHVKVFGGADLVVHRNFLAFPGFTGGVSVAAGDVNGDRHADIIVGAGPGAPGGHVKAFSGAPDQALLRNFLAFPGFTGGVSVAAGDVNGDRVASGGIAADIIVSAGPGAGPQVRVFDGLSGQLTARFFPFAASFKGGVHVASLDLDGHGIAHILTATGPGGSRARVFGGNPLAPRLGFIAFAGTGGIWIG